MKRIIPYVMIIIIITMCIFSKQCILAAKTAVNTCIYVLLPSLFPFFVFSRIFILSGGGEKIGKYFSFLTKPLFNIDGIGATPFFLGVLCGYPVGAKSAVELYNENSLTKQEAQNLIGFCNNSGPLFLIGAVGVSIFNSNKFGYLLYAVHIISAIITGIILRGKIKTHLKSSKICKKQIVNNIFVSSVEDSVITILYVFGYVILFAVITAFIKSAFITGLFEMTTGIFKVSSLNINISLKFILCAVISSWGGLSVHMQTMGIISKSDLSFKSYLISKLIHSFTAFFISLIAIKLFPITKQVFSSDTIISVGKTLNVSSAVCVGIMGIYLAKLNIIILRQKSR